jgi:hypothetical protein
MALENSLLLKFFVTTWNVPEHPNLSHAPWFLVLNTVFAAAATRYKSWSTTYAYLIYSYILSPICLPLFQSGHTSFPFHYASPKRSGMRTGASLDVRCTQHLPLTGSTHKVRSSTSC